MVFYTKDHIQYWADLFKRETVTAIHMILQYSHDIGIIKIYIQFMLRNLYRIWIFNNKTNQFFLSLRGDYNNLQHLFIESNLNATYLIEDLIHQYYLILNDLSI